MSQNWAANHSKQCSLPSTLSKQKNLSHLNNWMLFQEGFFFFLKAHEVQVAQILLLYLLTMGGFLGQSWSAEVWFLFFIWFWNASLTCSRGARTSGGHLPSLSSQAASAQPLSLLTCLPKWFLKISNTGGSTTTSGNLVCVLYKSAAPLKLNATFHFAHLGPKKTFETCMLMQKDWRAHGHECPPPTPLAQQHSQHIPGMHKRLHPLLQTKEQSQSALRSLIRNHSEVWASKATIIQQFPLCWGGYSTRDHHI